jgi:hypothetical protein
MVLPVKHLAEVVGFLNGAETITPVRIDRNEIFSLLFVLSRPFL